MPRFIYAVFPLWHIDILIGARPFFAIFPLKTTLILAISVKYLKSY